MATLKKQRNNVPRFHKLNTHENRLYHGVRRKRQITLPRLTTNQIGKRHTVFRRKRATQRDI